MLDTSDDAQKFKKSSQQFDTIMKRFENVSIDNVSRKDIKDAKKFIKQFYYGSVNDLHQKKMSKFVK